MAELNEGDAIPELRVTPDKYLPHRYAGASGDFNPIHIDPEFAKAVGLPQNILHGLYSMAHRGARLRRRRRRRPAGPQAPEVQFRGMGIPEQEIVVSGNVTEAGDGVATVAVQSPRRATTRSFATPRPSSEPSPGGVQGSAVRPDPRIGGCSPSGNSGSSTSWSARTWSPASPWAPPRSPRTPTSTGGPRPCAPSSRRSSARAFSPIRTPRPAACRPIRATASTPTRWSAPRRSRARRAACWTSRRCAARSRRRCARRPRRSRG